MTNEKSEELEEVMDAINDMFESILSIEQRIRYLENELGISYEEAKFERFVELKFKNARVKNVEHNSHSGFTVTLGGVPPEYIRSYVTTAEEYGYTWEIRESHPDGVTMVICEQLY